VDEGLGPSEGVFSDAEPGSTGLGRFGLVGFSDCLMCLSYVSPSLLLVLSPTTLVNDILQLIAAALLLLLRPYGPRSWFGPSFSSNPRSGVWSLGMVNEYASVCCEVHFQAM